MLPVRSRSSTMLALGPALLAGFGACRDRAAVTHRETLVDAGAIPRAWPSGDGLGLHSDVDLDVLRQNLACDRAPRGSPRGEACRLVEDFSRGGDVDSLPATGRATWYGQAFVLLGTEAEWREFYFLQCQPGRGKGAAPSKAAMEHSVAARALIPDDAAHTMDAERLLTALGDGSPPPGQSVAVRFVKTAWPEDGFRALSRTRGPSLYFEEFARAHFVRGAGRRLIVLEEQPGEVAAAELWPLP
jgi:hypothetical protein